MFWGILTGIVCVSFCEPCRLKQILTMAKALLHLPHARCSAQPTRKNFPCSGAYPLSCLRTQGIPIVLIDVFGEAPYSHFQWGQAARHIGQRLGGPGAKAFARSGPRQLEEQHGSGDRRAGENRIASTFLLMWSGFWKFNCLVIESYNIRLTRRGQNEVAGSFFLI